MSIVSAVVLLLGYLWMLWDPEKQTWHDKVGRARSSSPCRARQLTRRPRPSRRRATV